MSVYLYDSQRDRTFFWKADDSNYQTVQEYVVWDGKPDDFAGKRTCKVVLMETDHEQILAFTRALHSKSVDALFALRTYDELTDTEESYSTLGWDWRRGKPFIKENLICNDTTFHQLRKNI